jgi:hypothetical protein
MPGAGKRTKLLEQLKAIAAVRGVPFTLQMKSLSGSGGGIAEEDGEEGETAAAAATTSEQILYESSLIHTGFDIARMSMQDKQVLKPILSGLGQGSHVLAGEQGRGARILVLYHAHLLSSESILLLQACLEQNEEDISIWLTSELPVSQRIRDWFVEIPVAGHDRSFQAFSALTHTATHKLQPVANWPDIFKALFSKWLASPYPVIQDSKDVKSFVYELLMRNLRWVEATHFILDVLILHPEFTAEQRRACIAALANCEATAGGYTIPSYRIPILWENLFLQFRTILCKPKVVEVVHDSPPARRTGTSSKPRSKKAAAAVETK